MKIHKLVLAGSAVLQAVLGEFWETTDFDIWGLNYAINSLVEYEESPVECLFLAKDIKSKAAKVGLKQLKMHCHKYCLGNNKEAENISTNWKLNHQRKVTEVKC